MNKALSKSTSSNLIDLYTRIPDYSEVQHLGQSDFINTLERLKEEFRQCRASLYNEEFCSDSEYLAGKSSPANNGRSKTSDNLFYYSNKFTSNVQQQTPVPYGGSSNLAEQPKINNVTTGEQNNANFDSPGHYSREQFLSIKSCELHRPPYRATSASTLTAPNKYLGANETRSFLLSQGGKNNSSEYYDDYEDLDDDEDDEDYGGSLGRYDREWSMGSSSNSDRSISKWSSSPEIYRPRSRGKEYRPPSNVEQRILQRKSQNNSAPSVAFKDDPEELPKPTFKANPVPEHVYKPLYEFIMLKNQRRSDRVREQSKKRLLSQVKPFSFCKDGNQPPGKGSTRRSSESLNNTKPPKKKRNDALGNIKTNNNRLHMSSALFKAKPAPPRTKALLAAIRQKEQQDYRELKKRLRAETLLKNASLPPSMAAREKRVKITNAKIDEVLLDYQKSFTEDKRKNRNYRETSTGTDDTGVLTDEDRMTEDEYGSGITSKKMTTVVKPFKFSQRSPRKFTSFGTSRHSAAATGVFEASSNDNHASRLRYQAAKVKEQTRARQEEDELLKIMRAERRRQKLRDQHLHAWQHACSYSAEQDIAMRRQLRAAASILERETFVRDMSCMLSRVRSAPLLLEGGNRLERKQEPCKKHRDEFHKQTKNSSNRPWNKLSTPRLYTWSDGNKQNTGSNRGLSMLDRYGGGGDDDKSETAALAEGSLSNSDNECTDDDGRHGDRYKMASSLAGSEYESSDEENAKKRTLSTDVTKQATKDKGGNPKMSQLETNEVGNDEVPETDDDIDDVADGGGSDDEENETHAEKRHSN